MRYVILIIGTLILLTFFRLGQEVGFNEGYLKCEVEVSE